ncbi:hypothetical protein NVP1182O_10 [Vibrio phage 1.182.O._10N.286.46.E1]|nr:hypothetical protein NVP1182O_10 [Vibrio phage 1.182.O._10N.286.46.E1]
MARPKKEATHNVFTVDKNKVSKDDMVHDSEKVQVLIPKGMTYVQVRRALEIALLRIR